MSEPRVLILHVPAGAGHARAAHAVEQALRVREPRAQTEVRDALEFSSPLFKALYASSYNRVVSRAPRVWGYMYKRAERVPVRGFRQSFRVRFNYWNCRDYEHAAAALKPDVILCTQFLPAEVFAYLRERGRVRVPVTCAVTDYSVHPIWVCRGIDRYFVASQTVAEELASLGEVPPERIEVTGVPIDPRFATSIGQAAARRELGLDPDPSRLTVLVMGGGFGWGPIEGMVEVVLGLPASVQALVVAGRNEDLRERLRALVAGREDRIQVHGYTNRVELFLEASDVLVGKAGGLTSSEAMARGVPMVIFRPIPGQEERNCDYLQESGAAHRVHDLDELQVRLRHFLLDGEHLARMKAAAVRIGRPRSAFQVAESLLRAARPD
jgi:processive 1,2-diacylglycerol beta-glucosyltransferase